MVIGDSATVRDVEQSLVYVTSKLSKVIVYIPLVQDMHTLSVQPSSTFLLALKFQGELLVILNCPEL